MKRSKKPRPVERLDETPIDPREAAMFRRAMTDLDVVAQTPPAHAARQVPDRFVPAEQDPDDEALFARAMAQLGVVPDGSDAAKPSEPPPASPGDAVPDLQPRPQAQPAPPPAAPPTAPIDPREAAEFHQAMAALGAVPDKDRPGRESAGAGQASADRVPRLRTPRTEDLRVDETIDLHGFRVEDALGVLRTFLPQAQQGGSRTVRVVTGKGHHSRDGVGVLRDAVERWATKHGGRWLRGWAKAPRALGGGGAMVLYLRRSSDPEA